MRIAHEIDALYDAFVGTLPPRLREVAKSLPQRLGLAPHPDTSWSAVFSHEITLGAPALLAEAIPDVSSSLVREALLAHMLAIIEAFGTDRLDDGQIASDARLVELLVCAKRVRDDALRRVCDPVREPLLDFARADAESRDAMAAERHAMRESLPVSFERYEQISLAKQSVGLPACLALAMAAGWSAQRRAALSRMLGAIWLGLQLYDDVLDWEDDLSRGAAWPLALVRAIHAERGGAGPRERPTERDPVRKVVLESGVMARMLRRSSQLMRAARVRANVLGARQIAGWARARENVLKGLARNEAEYAGFAVRERALFQWASEVLA